MKMFVTRRTLATSLLMLGLAGLTSIRFASADGGYSCSQLQSLVPVWCGGFDQDDWSCVDYYTCSGGDGSCSGFVAVCDQSPACEDNNTQPSGPWCAS